MSFFRQDREQHCFELLARLMETCANGAGGDFQECRDLGVVALIEKPQAKDFGFALGQSTDGAAQQFLEFPASNNLCWARPLFSYVEIIANRRHSPLP
jgi:hypothetical protein